MSAHPMLQPVDWSRPPESLEGGVSAERLKLYRIVWNSAIAVTLRSPTLNYDRTLFTANGIPIAVMAVSAATSRQGYWRFRQDFPKSGWPQASTRPTTGTYRITAASPIQYGRITMGQALLEMESRAIGTPASTASLLYEAIEHTGRRLGATLALEQRNPASEQSAMTLKLTPRGKSMLDQWRAADLVGNSAKRQEAIEQVADGQASPLDVLSRRFPDVPAALLEKIAASIECQCERWRGLSQADGLRAMTRAQAKPPKLSGLPSWIDPQNRLPADHPLHRIREEMEQELALRFPTWTTLPGAEKARHRLRCLQAKRPMEPSIPPLDEAAQFNALVVWLAGWPLQSTDLIEP